MLSNAHFYHRTIRKLVVAFGSMFNNMTLVRYNKENTVEIERINVPLMYASKEKFYMRIAKDPDLVNPVGLTLPRMAFELTAITYDPLRKNSSFIKNFSDVTGSGAKKVQATAYNFDFNLYIFVRNTEDGTQLVEQILPYFTPDYTVTLDFLSLDNYNLDVPIIFNNINYDDSHEGDPESTRSIIWTLSFTMKGYMFGPVGDIKLITKSTANVYDNTFATNEIKEFTLNSGSGDYKTGELVYQGGSLDEAVASGYVKSWSNTSNTLVLVDARGTFTENDIVGAVTHAKYNVSSFAIDTNQLVNITVTPDPPTANAEDDYGFTTTITEYV